ncbi:hypothetical protein L211DRAFT_853533 [Terfezia boudieri ATCC MYA-4762]|uniref:Uncharacterized protein n=1 Tax=Terfezia boudieri ATCC MYA-4762 TaxID=1051890 RepID=A0A3N4LC88_9PEZI|nr:hypothetical protein L211DRAFT_853533 [Terfezia boudieri ATCC MYA-4762]
MQLKVTWRSRRERLGDGLDQRERVRRWKREKEKLRELIREKKKKCWQRFYEEMGRKDQWEVAKWAKDLWRLKGVIGVLRNEDREEYKEDEEKRASLVKNHFKWREEGRIEEEEKD